MTELSILGQTVRGAIAAEDLETFVGPAGLAEVSFTTEELCSLCPVTGQPDVYELALVYTPGPSQRCLESKSLKLYLFGFRNRGIFAESLAAEILAAVLAACEPWSAAVTVTQNVRGGLVLSATASHEELVR